MTKEALATICEQNIKDPSLQPRVVNGELETYCNVAARRVAILAGCDDFNAMPNANTMVSIMEASHAWQKVLGEEAHKQACRGNVVMAAKRYAVHGHIAVVYPAPAMERSGSWGHDVPIVANVGKENAIMRASKAFPVDKGEPTYYAWVGVGY